MSTLTKRLPPALGSFIPWHQGKVRDTYRLPNYPYLLLQIATDRISTHDVVHQSHIPHKGAILTAFTVFWTELLPHIPTHLMACGRDIARYVPDPLDTYPADILERAIVVRRLRMTPREIIFRGRLAGSLLKAYQAYHRGEISCLPYGLTEADLPPGLDRMSPFARPLFTPTDKSDTDDPVDAAETLMRYRAEHDLMLRLYEEGRAYALTRGFDIIDTKGEAGFTRDEELVAGDEILTPDCSRYVEADKIVIGQDPPWFDKQYVREYVEKTWAATKGPPLILPEDVIWNTHALYHELFERMTTSSLADFQRERGMC